MQFMFPLLTLAALAFPLASAHPMSENKPRALPPSIDPFYRPPSGFESKAPGSILRQRRIAAAFFGFIPQPIEAYQLLYRTNAIDGSPIATVTTIFKPLHAKKDSFVSLQTAYDSTSSICNPSYNYQLGALQTDIISSLEQIIMQAYLLSGYIVAAADYEGPDAAFLPGPLEGMGVLDGMRAVVNFRAKLGLSDNPKIVGTGYSGGAVATGWAAGLQSSYAPDLNVKGWVAGGTPANLTATFMNLDSTIFSGFLPAGLAGFLKPSAYGAQLQPIFDEILTPKGKRIIDTSNKQCIVGNLLSFPQTSILSAEFQTLGPGLFQHPVVSDIMGKHVMGVYKNETPVAPVFLYHAPDDEIVPYHDAGILVDRWCGYGASVDFLTVAAGGHFTTEILGVPDAVRFTANAFEGKLAAGCSTRTSYNDTLNPIALGVQLEPVLASLLQMLVNLGKKDASIKQDLTKLGRRS
ncbi:Lipase 5 [Metarhizium anisopliae]